ncbi:MAG: SAF domain-containing protein [Acidiferrobacterales bacterium]|nr:SAF domain-containing protein [Acidiferrobacterales bacterium]
MNLYSLLQDRERTKQPIRVGIIGVGKFATMFMAQIIRTPGMKLVGVCDLDLGRTRNNLHCVGFTEQDLREILITEDSTQLLERADVDVVVESTGDPIVGARHALMCIEHRTDVVMVNVEADVLVGAVLATRARENGVIYSLAYGDQPALIVEQVDAVRSMGLEVVCAGKGTKYLPSYHHSTPDTVWDHYGLTREDAEKGGMNSKMFNSFLDGTKSAIEMTAVANATGLSPPHEGLTFPACSVDELGSLLIPQSDGGILPQKGMVEVVSSLNRDGTEVDRDLRWGVYVVFEAGTEYVARCFREYGLLTDSTGRYSALYRPYHLIGLELGISVASVALRREPTGCPMTFAADAVSVAKRDLGAGEVLDGEGGSTVWGKILPAQTSLNLKALPIGFASKLTLRNSIAEGSVVTWNDVMTDELNDIHRLRKKMEQDLSKSTSD